MIASLKKLYYDGDVSNMTRNEIAEALSWLNVITDVVKRRATILKLEDATK